VIGALFENRKLEVRTLAENPEIDLRHAEHAFISQKTTDPWIGRILCLEMIGTNFNSLEQNLDALLFTLYKAEIKGLRITSIIMPLLGTGNQQINSAKVMEILLKKIEYLLLNSTHIEEVMLVAYQDEQAKRLNASMNSTLGRKPSLFKQDQIMSAVIGGIIGLYKDEPNCLQNKAFLDLHAEICQTEIDATKLAIIARSMCEYILSSLYPSNLKRELAGMIPLLRERGAQPWIESYFHLIRVFGNVHAHDQPRQKISAQIGVSDLLIVLFGIERVLRFYVDEIKKGKTARRQLKLIRSSS
jgi:hypothetical protein